MAEQQTTYNKNRAAARRMLAAEVGFAAAIALLLFPMLGMVAARSAVLGALIFILPHALFVGFVFRATGEVTAGTAVRGLYVGEALKLIATVILFAAGFMLVKPLNVGALFGTYLTLLLVNLFGSAYLMR